MNKIGNYNVCANCVMDTSDPNIQFADKGMCERCNQYYNEILPSWPQGAEAEKHLLTITDKIKKAGKNKKYDSILGLSGGFDSSYMLHFAIKELGLRPLVFHVDAGWNTPLAVENINKLVSKLNVELKTEVIDWEEMKDFQLAFFKSGVPHLDIPQDHAFISVLYNYAEDNGIKYILNGGNISTEVVVNPAAWYYWGTDLVHINDIIRQFCRAPLKKYPFSHALRHKVYLRYIKNIQVLKLLNYIPYIKKDAETLLKKEYGFTPYPQKHFESIMTKFIEGYWLPKRFGYDVRRAQFSSLILTKQMSREEALDRLALPPIPEDEAKALFNQVAQMLEVSPDELQSYFAMPLKTYRDYKHQGYLFDIGARVMYALRLDKLIRR
ncbi:MAG TPA: N-acetyl sugar amidotransferase [Smithellaceae bacterium]|nr:N-acetyl sugar amidotransferase [Paludibacter sp.]HPK53821.1 N-acetyl sugar amidotransferase [Smithellaceae bacterium]